MINACNPWNKGACAIFNHQPILFIEAEIPDEFEFEGVPGTIITLGEKEGLQIGCNDRKLIRINVICTPEGIFSSKKLWEYGLKPGELFISK
jgi:methionyl-tRNA formyltransferase